MSSARKDTRERILQTTWRLLEKNWRQGVRLEDIAHDAGVSRQAMMSCDFLNASRKRAQRRMAI
jgi:transcriptional regulator GlxA family with amidase domain